MVISDGRILQILWLNSFKIVKEKDWGVLICPGRPANKHQHMLPVDFTPATRPSW